MGGSFVDYETFRTVFIILGQSVAISVAVIGFLMKYQRMKFEELRKSIEVTMGVNISAIEYETKKTKALHEAKIGELEKIFERSFSSVKLSLSECVSLAVCQSRMMYEDKVIVTLEKGIEKLGEKLDFLTTLYMEKK